MLELLAIAAEDGWAYVRNETGIYLVRPPYAKSTRQFTDMHTVDKAVVGYGFTGMRKEFPGWEELIAFLREQIDASLKARGMELARSGLGEEMLRLAPPDVLARFLDRVENELLPQHEWDHAENLLLAVLKLPVIGADAELYRRTIDLLDANRDKRKKARQARRMLETGGLDLGRIARLTVRRYPEEWVVAYTQQFEERGQIFA
ncbi:MAG: hypothetical protein JW759_01420 [Candidatus Coatesbacteria bacterium]|nr:hypothetical protein [Candidatus Coatesbacteria bacterium]